ncbi:S-methyl-5-thioribose-1-phosphate isomerase [Quaeritorhiza haematococci]|nr:S-methyl-5-thioribose-1-phosphate isomerase [Quaeritorhiza haematococci]
MTKTANAPSLEAIRYRKGSLEIINQLLLPFETVYEEVKDVSDGHVAIKTMKVRGAPAIAIVAALSLAVELHLKTVHSLVKHFPTVESVVGFINSKLDYLKTSRPTAVNLFDAADKLSAIVAKAASEKEASPAKVVDAYINAAEAMLKQDIEDNRNIGSCGADYIVKHRRTEGPLRVLTHCNTGSLATAGWGTALGIIRELHSRKTLDHVFCTETRPYNQGSRLTAYELVYDAIPSTLICDNMASALLKLKNITAIIVGADRVASNGDTANKIGTYQLAIAAKHHGVMFIVAAPSTSVDLSIKSGDDIVIEERAAMEVVQIRGQNVEDEAGCKEPSDMGPPSTSTVHIAAKGIGVWNPAFDVTPASLITAIATEKGVVEKDPATGLFPMKKFLQGS